MSFKQTKAHKVAKKVASSSPFRKTDTINIFDWLAEVNPELLKQFNAIKDLEEAVDQTDLELHYQIHLERMAMLDNMLAESNKRIKKLLKGMLK